MGQAPTLDHGPAVNGSTRPANGSGGVHYAPAAARRGTGGRLVPACLPALLDAPETELRQVVRLLPPLQRQQSLFADGGGRGQLFIVLSGQLQSLVQAANGEEQVVDFHLPGDVAGFTTGTYVFREGRVVALERCSVCAITLARLLDLAPRVNGLQAQLYAVIERALAGTEQHVLMMGRRSSRERVALFLHTWSGRVRAAGFCSTDLDLPMRREDIASYLGLATETASRAISWLHQSGVIAVRNRHVEIHDPDRLAALAGADSEAAPGAGARPALVARR